MQTKAKRGEKEKKRKCKVENIKDGRNIKYKMITIDTTGLNSPKLRLLDLGKGEEEIQDMFS